MCLSNGGSELYPALKEIFLSYESWDEERWQKEVSRYETIWKKHYSLPINTQNLSVMNGKYFLSIDNGTQSVRAIVFDGKGQLIAKSKIEIEP